MNTQLEEIHEETKKANENTKDERYNLRKRICQKIAKLLQKSYPLEKEKSQELSIIVEDKLNRHYVSNVNEYKQAVKIFHNLVKVHFFLDNSVG